MGVGDCGNHCQSKPTSSLIVFLPYRRIATKSGKYVSHEFFRNAGAFIFYAEAYVSLIQAGLDENGPGVCVPACVLDQRQQCLSDAHRVATHHASLEI